MLIAAVLVVVLVAGGVWFVNYRHGARCRDAKQLLHTAAVRLKTAQDGSGVNSANAVAAFNYLRAVVNDDPQCFNATTRAFVNGNG